MIRPDRTLAVAMAMTMSVLAFASRAWGGVEIGRVDAGGYPTVKLVAVTSTPTTTPPVLRENGVEVPNVHAQNLAAQTSVVVAVDRSHSMRGRSLTDAAAAADSFVVGKPASDDIAIVTFGKHAEALTGFSSSTIDADSALRSIAVDPAIGTALYDAVVLASKQLAARPSGGKVIVLLTDGEDISSTATLDDAIAAARRAGAQVFPIAIAGPDYKPEPLRQLAAETGGTFETAASSSVLQDVYRSIAARLARTWTFQYETAARPGQQLSVSVAVPSEGSAVRHLTLPASATPGAPGPAFLPASAYRSPLTTFLVALVAAVLLLLAVLFGRTARKALWVRARVDGHMVAERRRGRRRRSRERGAALTALLQATERAFGNLRQWRALRRLLERADVPLRAAEFAWITLGSALVVAAVAGLASRSAPIALVGLLVGASIPLAVVWLKARRRLSAFENQLPDLLLTLAASLKAGHSFRHGIQTVVSEGQAPASDEFKRVLTDTQLGRPMEDSLLEMSGRVGSKNFDFVITAVTIQRQVGGSLAGLFDMVADTVRQRQQFARRIRSLTAMGRMSAYVLVGLPFFLVMAMSVLNSAYLHPLLHTGAGHFLLMLAFVMMSIGSLILKKIVSFRG